MSCTERRAPSPFPKITRCSGGYQDLRTAAAHIQAAPIIFELTGALLLGADVEPSVLL